MCKPLVSIIIPTYNRASLIHTAINSVINQSYKNWECIIIDDGSNDNSIEVLKEYSNSDSRISYYSRYSLPKGAPTCRNIGLEKAKGEFVIFLDSDDYLLPFCVEQRVDYFLDNMGCHFLVFPMAVKRGNIIKKKTIKSNADHLILFLSANLPWQTMCPIWKKSVLISLKGFTEGYPRFNDPELMIRALLLPNIKYKSIEITSFDCVHLHSPSTNDSFLNQVFEGLKLFIPDISLQLENNDKTENKKYLALYLHLWFKYFYVPMGINKTKNSLELINIFKKHRIISFNKTLSLKIRCLIFVLSTSIFKKPINKLSEKALYT